MSTSPTRNADKPGDGAIRKRCEDQLIATTCYNRAMVDELAGYMVEQIREEVKSELSRAASAPFPADHEVTEIEDLLRTSLAQGMHALVLKKREREVILKEWDRLRELSRAGGERAAKLESAMRRAVEFLETKPISDTDAFVAKVLKDALNGEASDGERDAQLDVARLGFVNETKARVKAENELAEARSQLAAIESASWKANIDKLRALEDNWDGYASIRPKEAALKVAEFVHAAPMSNGGIQIDFGADRSVEISPEGVLSCEGCEVLRDRLAAIGAACA